MTSWMIKMEKIMNKIKNVSELILTNIFERFFASWFLSSAVVFMLGDGTISLENADIVAFAVVFPITFLIMSVTEILCKNTVHLMLVLSVLVFSIILLIRENNIYTFIALAIFFCISLNHYFNKTNKFTFKISQKKAVIMIVLCFVFFFGIVTAKSVLRYLNYATPNYDFGIFCNMYYNMKTSFLPVTTCERDELLSHFAVHFSPALYLFLPVYYIFPSPVTVAVCQTAAIYSGLIPFILIMKNRKIEPFVMCLFSVVFLANTAFSMGCSYDFHENCMLVPFVLWMIYFYERKKTPLLYLFAVLTLTVKEDAFIYVVIFAAFVIFSNKDWKTGIPLAVVAVGYFVFACWYIEKFGLGIMEGRFDSMINGDEGLFGIIKTLFANLSYSVSLIFSTEENTADKLIYVMQILCPIGFIPFFTKKPSRLILVLPIFLNLLTDYKYQYDIKFQYGFGLTALMLYACILNIEDMKPKKRSFFSCVAAGLAVMLFFMSLFPTFLNTVTNRIEKKEIYDEIDAVLSEIDDDASVCASTFLLPHLADRKEIYEVHYTDHTEFDYLILDFRPGYKNGSLEFAEKFESYGYVQIDSGSEYVGMYVKTD